MRSLPGALALVVTCALGFALVGCSARSAGPAAAPPPAYPPGSWGTPPPPPGGATATPGGAAAPPAPGTVGPGGVSPAGMADPINRVELGYLRSRAQSVYVELMNALAPGPRSRVTGIPLIVDDEPGEVNAFAACTSSGKAIMAISDGLLEISAYLARCAATDEVFRTRKTDEYIRFIAQNQRPGQPIVRPAPTFFDPTQDNDATKLTRQHQLFDEEVAFVLGHEMGHHYLGHLPCTAGNVEASEVGAVLTSVVPAFNQVNEAAADNAGTYNVLDAGKARADYHYTERGALLTMQFFAGIDQFSPVDLIFGFDRTHPPPQLRSPLIMQAAATWRATGGARMPWLL
jgi:hypothetical protein